MGRRIVKQPNGKLALYSSITDSFIVLDATEKELLAFYVKDYKRKAAEDLAYMMRDMAATPKDWDHYCKIVTQVHGEEAAKEIKELTK